MADINAVDLTAETISTLDGNEQFVMFDIAEGKRATLSVIGKYIQNNIYPDINTSASSGTVDGDLYRAIVSLGWQSNVIS